MKDKFPVVTLCGSTRFKKDFEAVQKKLTLDGFIVISVGLFGHSGDSEVWEGMDEGTLSETKVMLDDMHKSKIDLAEAIYVVNPGGYIGSSTWSEICYAFMTDKKIMSLEPIDEKQIELKVRIHTALAEKLAWQQYDTAVRQHADYDGGYPENQTVYFKYNRRIILDPWMIEGDRSKFDTIIEPYYGHGNLKTGYDPFKKYPKEKLGKFIEAIVTRACDDEIDKEEKRQLLLVEAEKLMELIPESRKDLKDYPYSSVEDIKEFIACWSEYHR